MFLLFTGATLFFTAHLLESFGGIPMHEDLTRWMPNPASPSTR